MNAEALTPSQRTFRDVETGYNCRMYTSGEVNKKYHLIYEGQHDKIADGSEVNGYYIAAHTGATIKLNTGKKILVDSGQFYSYKEGEHATHRKFTGFKGFSKI